MLNLWIRMYKKILNPVTFAGVSSYNNVHKSKIKTMENQKKYYFVGESKTNKILGFNLTEEEKDKLFYYKPIPSGGMSSEGRFYGATEFRIKNKEEFDLIMNIRSKFKNNVRYSYLILDKDNNWLATGQNESEKMLIETIHEVRDRNNNAEIIIFEVLNNGIII